MGFQKESNFENARRYKTQQVTGAYFLPNGIDIILCNTIGGNCDVYLPDAYSFSIASEITIKKITDDANRVRIFPSGSNLIDGQSYLTLPRFNDSVIIKAQAGFWIVKASSITSQISSGSNPENDSFMLTPLDIESKQVALSRLPNFERLVSVFSGGLRHTWGNDYRIVGNILSWDGLGLETALAAYDRLEIDYFY